VLKTALRCTCTCGIVAESAEHHREDGREQAHLEVELLAKTGVVDHGV
jgi:hypothetical protein